MVQNTKTRGYIRPAAARSLMGSHFLSSTATSGTTTSLTDSKIANSIYASTVFNNRELNVSGKWSTPVVGFTQAAGAFTFTTQASAPVNGDPYEVYPRSGWSSQHFNDAIDRAIEEAAHRDALSDATDESLAYQCYRSQYPLPAWSYIHRIAFDCRYNYIARNAPGHVDSLMGIKDTAGRTKIAQSFTTSSYARSLLVNDLYLLLAKVGNPSGTITISLESNTVATEPDGTPLVSMTLSTASTTLAIQVRYMRFLASVAQYIQPNTKYWIVATSSSSADPNNYVGWAKDDHTNYSPGEVKVFDGATWSTVTGGLIFSLREPYPRLVDLEYRKHWILSRQTARQFELTEAGLRLMRVEDGAAFYLEGQSRPALPVTDNSTIDVPFDFLHFSTLADLASSNPDWYARLSPNNQQLPYWREKSLKLGENLRTPFHANAVQIEAM